MKKILVFIAISFILLALLFIHSSISEERSATLVIDRAATIAASAEITAEEYPDADVVLIDSLQQVKYHHDGTYEQWDEQYFKVLTDAGRKNFLTITSFFVEPYQTEEGCTIPLVEVIKPDGTVIVIDDEATVMVDSSSIDSNIYGTNNKLVKVNVPEVDVGDTIHFIMYDNIVYPRVKDMWYDMVLFENTFPIRHMTYSVSGPKDMPLESIALKGNTSDDIISSSYEGPDSLRYTWECSDVPQVFLEPSMPSFASVAQRLLLSTTSSWEELSQWYWDISLPRYTTSSELEDAVNAIVYNVNTPEEKIEALFYWVAQNIRYSGVIAETVSPGYEPHEVTMTFEKKMGVCRDKAALLVVMLRYAGFEAYPVIIHNGPKKDIEVPMPYFNHAIVCVSIDGEYILMDPTDEMTKDLLPAYLSNKSFLVARPDGETLLTSPTAPAEDNMMVVVTNANIADSGELRAESSLTFEGINDNAYRNAFANMKESDILRFFESRIAEAIPGATLKHLSIAPTDILDTSVPLSVSITYEATDAVISGDDATIISLPHLGISRQGSNEGFGIINFILSENTSLESRVFPLDLYTTCGVYEDITLSIDKSFGAPISLPDDVENESGTVFWKRDLDYSIDRTTTKLHETSTFMIKTLEFSPEEYLSLKDTIKDVEYDQRKVPILSKDNDEEIYYDDDGDIVIENLLIDYDIIDENSWTKTVAIKKEVLTYGGKKDNSEITVRYNPSWDNIDIVDITITDADGTTHHPNNNEINIMDATWVGSAPRYPAEKLLTIVLPGVDIGSTIEHTLRHTYTKRPFFSTMETFRYLDPLSSKKVTITAPKKIELQTLKTDAGIAVEAPNDGIIAESIDDNDDKTIFQWEAYNISSAKESSLPPPWYCYNPTVLCSSGTWEKYAPVVSKTLHSAVDDADAMEDLFDKITSDFDDDKAVIAAVRDYVDKKVRLVPIAFYDMPLSAISPAAKTLNDGYGHSADRAIVLYSILSAGGLDPEFVMASYSTDIDIIKNHVQGLPDFTLFGEILVRVPHEEGYVYLNDTSRHAAIGTTPHNGFLGIVIDDAELITIGSLPDTKERKYDSYNISLDDTGAATITYNKAFYGVGYQNMKDMFDAMSPEDLRRYQNDIAATFSTSATVVDDITINFSKHPGTMSINIAIDNFAVVDNENMYFTLPHTLKELFPTSSEKRTIPLLWDSSLDITILTTITLPEGYTEILIAPEDLRYELPNNAGDIVVSSSYDDNTITLIHTTKILPALFDAAEYSVLKDINEKLSHPRSRTIMVKNENNDQ